MKKPPSNSVKLSIVIVNFNGGKWLDSCLHSFKNIVGWPEKKKELEVIIVDNGSSDGSGKKAKRDFSWIELIELTKNAGFSAGNNIGLEAASGEYLMLLNSDTELPKDTDLLLLLEDFSNSKVGVVTPRLNLTTGEIDHACHRGFPTPWNAMCYFSGLAKMFPKWPLVSGYRQSWKDLSQPHSVDCCSGAAMIVSRKAYEEVGPLDERFFFYAEDIDWCYRFSEKGFLTWYDPRVILVHHKHKSGQKSATWETKEVSTSAFFDTMKQFMDKHYQERYPKFVLWISSVMIDRVKYWKLASERKKYDRTISAE